MNINYSFFADAVSIDISGKVNALGIFDGIFTKKLPFTHSKMFFVVKIHYSRSEYGKHKIRLLLINPDGIPVFPVHEIDVDVVEGSDSSIHIVDFNRISFSEAGPHEMNVSVNEQYIGSTSLTINRTGTPN